MSISATKRHGRLVILLLTLGLLLGLAACAQGSSGTTGTISGDVVAAPTCPVQSNSTCQPKPVTDHQVTIETTSGSTVTTTKTDSNGHFTVNVAPGDYVVKVQPTVGGHQVTPGNVTVTANHTTTIHIVMDTGIR